MEKMNSKMELDKNNCGSDSNNGQLLRDIEEISRALYLQKPSSKSLVTTSNVRSKSVGKTRLSESKSKQDSRNLFADVMQKDKKSSSLWNWKKPLKALTNIRRHRFDICFFLHVHSIEGLPAYLNDFSLCVNWKRKDEVLSTHAARVVDGIAEFEETLTHKCYVYGKSGPHNAAKYEMKLFLIYASIVGAPGNSLGEHWIDLTRLLPLTLEDLEGEKGLGKWTTSFKLSGKAKGATLNVSFSFLVSRDNLVESSGSMNASNFISLTETGSSAMGHGGGLHASNGNGMLHRVGTVPSNSNHRSYLSPLSVDMKFGTEMLPNLGVELSKSISFLYQKLNEENFHSPSGLDKLSEHVEPPKPNSESAKGMDEHENIDFFVIDQGVEMCQKDPSRCEQSDIQIIDGSAIEIINVDEILKDCDSDVDEEAEHVLKVHSSSSCKEVAVDDCRQEKRNIWSKTVTVQELESAFQDMLLTESSVSESPSVLDEFIEHDKFMEVKSNYKASKVKKKSLSLDDIADTVATDFLKMLEIEHDPFSLNSDSALESPRERLLREFENEALASGDFVLDFGAGGEEAEIGSTTPGSEYIYEDFAFSSVILASEEQKMESLSLKNRRKVNMLENLETEALMLEWGLDEKAFQSSPHVQTDGFGSPITLSPEQGELPPLGDGFGHFIPTKDGGVLRSMNPSLFRNCKNDGHLVMQVSRAAVFPARLGTDIMEILQNFASLGIEDLSLQVNTIMPLEDVTGKTWQQVALGAMPRAVVRERRVELQQESLCDQDSFYQRKEVEGFQCCWSYNNLSSVLGGSEMSPGCMSLENLVSSAMNRIEALAIEGLKIQCGMSDEDAPSTVSPLSSSNMYFITGKDSKFGKFFSLERAAGSQSLDFRDDVDDVDDVNRLMGLSITLDEWLRLDAGIIGDEDQISDHTMQLLVAHKAKCIDLVSGILTKHVNLGKASSRKHGLLGNNFTLALMVLLRDPLRNYEPVGTPMIALIQVERASVPLEQGICSTEPEGDQEENREEDGEEKKEGTPFFKITEVHLAGLITEPDKQYLWGTKAQQQSGTRWLLSSGTAKSNMNTFSKSKAIVKFYPPVMRKMQARNVMWSLTSNVHETETSWKELADLGPHSRNPNVIFPK